MENVRVLGQFTKTQICPFLGLCVVYCKIILGEDVGNVCCYALGNLGEYCSRCYAAKSRRGRMDIEWVYSYLEAVHNYVNLCTLLPMGVKNDPISRWSEPTLNHFRVHVDAGYYENRNCFSTGVVIRDCNGQLVGATAHNIRHPGSVLGGELAAILQGLRCCLLKNISVAHIFSDSQVAVN